MVAIWLNGNNERVNQIWDLKTKPTAPEGSVWSKSLLVKKTLKQKAWSFFCCYYQQCQYLLSDKYCHHQRWQDSLLAPWVQWSSFVCLHKHNTESHCKMFTNSLFLSIKHFVYLSLCMENRTTYCFQVQIEWQVVPLLNNTDTNQSCFGKKHTLGSLLPPPFAQLQQNTVYILYKVSSRRLSWGTALANQITLSLCKTCPQPSQVNPGRQETHGQCKAKIWTWAQKAQLNLVASFFTKVCLLLTTHSKHEQYQCGVFH